MVAFNKQLANTHKMDFPLIIFLVNCLLSSSFIHSIQRIPTQLTAPCCFDCQAENQYICTVLSIVFVRTSEKVFILQFSTPHFLRSHSHHSVHLQSRCLCAFFACAHGIPLHIKFHLHAKSSIIHIQMQTESQTSSITGVHTRTHPSSTLLSLAIA